MTVGAKVWLGVQLREAVMAERVPKGLSPQIPLPMVPFRSQEDIAKKQRRAQVNCEKCPKR